MIIRKLILKNFKPYFGQCEINLFDSTRREQNLTLNIGPTNNGKTSISEGIMWCLFGEEYKSNWSEFVNNLARETELEKKGREVNMSVTLEIFVSGNVYSIIRSGDYDIRNDKQSATSPSIISNGTPIDEDPEEFMNQHFVTLNLMGYFIFDAEQILKYFEENQEKAIKDSIDKIVGVGMFDEIVNVLNLVIDKYSIQEATLGKYIDTTIPDKIIGIVKDIEKKELAIKQLIDENAKHRSAIATLFSKGSPSSEEQEIASLLDRKLQLNQNIKEIKEKFLTTTITYDDGTEDKLIENIYLLVLKNVLLHYKTILEKEKVTKNEFETSLNLLKRTLSSYKGIIFENQYLLIPKSAQIELEQLEKIDKLEFSKDEGDRLQFLSLLTREIKKQENAAATFEKIQELYEPLRSEFISIDNRISRIGSEVANEMIKEKVIRYQALQKQIKENNGLIREIRDAIASLEKEKNESEQKKEHDDQSIEGKNLCNKRIELCKKLISVTKAAKKEFMKDLLNTVNDYSSKFLQATIKDKNRFNSIKVSDDYILTIKDKNGVILKQSQINTGTTQIALMAFFFGLSNYLKKKIPFVIDNPLMRLDVGHDRRLIEQLGKLDDQIIMHLIPSKEYSKDSYAYFRGSINTQNWIKKELKPGGEYEVSTVEKKDSTKFIEFDIEAL
ncbi:AAA family ATPase [Candidatus Woesearchaeota archaeon]|nr:AAA family ATPase [Candidatus Woesearchaeota archaeon]